MDESNVNHGTLEQPTKAGEGDGSTEVAALHKDPVKSVTPGSNRGAAAGGGLTLSVKCTVTLKSGAALFGGAESGGGKIGHPDNGNGDVVLELEGNAKLDGVAAGTKFSGANPDDSKPDHPAEKSGKPKPRKQLQSAEQSSYEPSPGKGGS